MEPNTKTTRRTALKLIAGAGATLTLGQNLLAQEGAMRVESPAHVARTSPDPHRVSDRFSTAGFFAIPESPRKVFNFNLGWRFLKGDARNAQVSDFDDRSWEAARLPHGLEIMPQNASGDRNYQGPAWYRKRFRAPASAGERTFLYFEAVMGKCTVWVNAQKVAEHFGGYLPFATDLTGVLNPPGRDNLIAVHADNSDDPAYPPGKPQQDLDFTYMGGIYRDVFLIQTGPVYVSFPEISTTVAGGGVFVAVREIKGTDAELEVRTEVINASTAPSSLTLHTTLEDASGNELCRQETKERLSPGAWHQVVQSLSARKLHLWQPNDPYLHRIRTEVVQDGQIVDSLRTRFGIRIYQMQAQDGLFINNKYIGYKLSGVNRHQDYVYVGNALPKSGQWRDAMLLREGGTMIVRAAHEPLSPAFLDACDELGLLVTSVNPGWQFYNANDPVFKERLIGDTRQMVRRDRNRPSIILWETAINETPDQSIEAVHQLHVTAHDEYPFPGLFTATDRDIAKPAGLDFYYYASDKDPVNSFTREYGDGGEVDDFYSQNAQTRVNRAWGELAMLNQLRIRAADLDDVFGTSRQQIGSALWAGIDHQRGYHPDPFWGGLVDTFRIPRYAYYLFKSQYDPGLQISCLKTGPLLYITNELTQVSDRDVIVLTNCEEVRLTWMGQIVGTQSPDPEYKHLPHPPITFKNVFDFHRMKKQLELSRHDPPEMIAEGLIAGKVVVRQAKLYAERTTGVKLALDDWGMPLVADGSDFVPVRANIVDQKGILKVLATEYVYFDVDGPGEVIGGEFNHGNPMRTEFGTATALIRATSTPGKIKVRAYVDGLKADEITIDSISSPMAMIYDETYAKQSRVPTADRPSTRAVLGLSGASADVDNLKDQIHELQLQLTDKEQQFLDLRNKCKPQ